MGFPRPSANGTKNHQPRVGIESLDPALEREAKLLSDLLQVLNVRTGKKY